MNLRNFWADLKLYLTSKYFWRTVLGLAIFVIAVVGLSSLYLKIYTRHGENILTPELRGMTVEQAQKIIKRKHLRLKIIDSTYEGVGEPGTIIDQTPPANFNIKKGRAIFVTVKAFGKKMVTLPDLTSSSLTEAKYILSRIGLKIRRIKYEPSANFDDLILAVLYNGDTLKPGTSLPQDTKLDLVVAKLIADTVSQEVSDTTQPIEQSEPYSQEF